MSPRLKPTFMAAKHVPRCRVCRVPICARATYCRTHGRSHQQRGTTPRTLVIRDWQQQPDLPAHIIDAMLKRGDHMRRRRSA